MSKKFIMGFIIFTLILTGCSGKSSSASSASTTSPSSSSSSSSSSSHDLGSALNLVLGSDSTPSVFDSYHIDVNLNTPQLNDDNTKVVNENTIIAADVAGKDIHILQTDPGATTQKEGFIIGEKEYKMVGGAPQEMMGQIALSWAMWPLQVVLNYAYPVYWAKKTGTDSIDGHNADVYTFDSADASKASDAAMSAMGAGDLTAGKGSVWIDQKTGAMLKLDMTYSKSVKDNNQKEIGSGSGSIKIEITKVGQVTVTPPK